MALGRCAAGSGDRYNARMRVVRARAVRAFLLHGAPLCPAIGVDVMACAVVRMCLCSPRTCWLPLRPQLMALGGGPSWGSIGRASRASTVGVRSGQQVVRVRRSVRRSFLVFDYFVVQMISGPSAAHVMTAVGCASRLGQVIEGLSSRPTAPGSVAPAFVQIGSRSAVSERISGARRRAAELP